MAISNSIATKPQGKQSSLAEIFKSRSVDERFSEVLGEKKARFLVEVMQIVKGNEQLRQADPMTVVGSAMQSATLDLDPVQGLGFSALIPYNNRVKNPVTGQWESVVQCQFQIMAKGFIQLAQRSGKYLAINAGALYKDEYDGMDLVTGKVRYHEVQDGMRVHDDGNGADIAGFFAYFKLLNGYEHMEFWDMPKIWRHAKKYSKTYLYKPYRKGGDMVCPKEPAGVPEWEKFKANTPWNTNWQAMARKTVLKNTLSNWGVLSLQMEQGLKADQAVVSYRDTDNLQDADLVYADNPENYAVSDEGEVIGGEAQQTEVRNATEEPKAKGDAILEMFK